MVYTSGPIIYRVNLDGSQEFSFSCKDGDIRLVGGNTPHKDRACRLVTVMAPYRTMVRGMMQTQKSPVASLSSEKNKGM